MRESVERGSDLQSGGHKYLYVDRHVREEVRAQAQGLLVVFTQGIGFLLSSLIFVGLIFPRIVVDDTVGAQWQRYWLTPVGFMATVLGLFWFLFRDDKTPAYKKLN